MIWSGLLIYWANDVYRIGWNKNTLLKFFPESFYQALNVPFRLADGMSLHFVFMWFFALNGIIYFFYSVLSGEWRYLWPDKRSFKEAWEVILHDFHIRKTKPVQLKYNAAQRIIYSAIILMGFGSIITGLAIYKPVQLHWLTWILGGYGPARIEHFVLTIGYVLFFLIHIIQVLLAGWNTFRGMVAGFEVEKTHPLTITPKEIPDKK